MANCKEMTMNIQWYPGHMEKTRRMMAETLKLCDVICEIVDARIPRSSRNPVIAGLTEGKPKVMILNRVDQADPAETGKWASYFRGEGYSVLETDCKSGKGLSRFNEVLRDAVSEKIKRYADRRQTLTVRAIDRKSVV